MPAPGNDNFASATAVSTGSGSVTGTNVSSTTESGEPGHYNFNPGPSYPVTRVVVGPFATVWYSWSCPASGKYFFSTRDGTGGMATTFLSTVNVFTGAAVNALTRVTTLMDQSSGDGWGDDNGASIAFAAVSGTTYYIQVDSRFSVATGVFKLTWGSFSVQTFGDCGNAPLNWDASVVCLGSVQVTDLTVNGFYSFGSQPQAAGKYAGRLIYGNFINGYPFVNPLPIASFIDGDLTGFTIWNSFPTYTPGNVVWQEVSTGGGVPAICLTSNLNMDPYDYCASIYWDCLQSGAGMPTTQCSNIIIPHPATGVIGLMVIGNSGSTNTTKNPVYQLIYYPLTLAQLSNQNGFGIGNAAGIGALGTTWNINFAITNSSSQTWDNTTVTLLATGGVSSPSGPLTISLAAGGTTNTGIFTMTADPTAGLVTATIQIARNGIVVGNLVYPLYPIYSVPATPGSFAAYSCSGHNVYWATLTAQILWPPTDMNGWGYLNTGHTADTQNAVLFTFTLPSGPNLFNNPSCTVVSSIQANQGGIGYLSGSPYMNQTFEPGIYAAGAPANVGVQMTLGFQVSASVTIALPTYTSTWLVPGP